MPITPPPPPEAIHSIDQFGLRPASPRRRSAAGFLRDPNWTLATQESSTVRNCSNIGVTVADSRAQIPGTRTALTQFAMRNQRIVADPFPNSYHCPRRVTERRNPILLGPADPFEGKRPSSARPNIPQSGSVISERTSFNTTTQRYQTRTVTCPDPSDVGLASRHACFDVDTTQTRASEWSTSSLNVLHELHPSHKVPSERASSTVARGGVAVLKELNYPRLGTPREAVVEKRQITTRAET
eukprot:CAMPEP_0176416540 /NCGR_PEP_ID=MMETSP0127-20121128/6403_1 /TAXON_ID=938130 /ORGANISM="Platyophrya macrostoma, Strain WH" /LENGTH=240 /DNA_ID=CAMNT_0017796627 /DNA_START=70 /DNA_END=788 /DNA_ORIENTATION=-